MKEKQSRQSNIELLRILAMLGVIILHYNNVDAGGGFKYVAEGSLNYYILYTLGSATICAVDLFMLISGYFLSTSKRRVLWKPIELLSQVMLFNLVIYLVRSIIAGYKLSAKAVMSSMIPANYFVVLYAVVYIISPYINLLLETLTRKQLDVFVGILMILFAVCPTFVDVLSVITDREWQGLSTIGMYGRQRGYTIVNFALMYIIGAYLRLRGLEKSFKTKIGVDADAQYTRNDGLGSVESEHRLGVLQSACYSNRSAYIPSL